MSASAFFVIFLAGALAGVAAFMGIIMTYRELWIGARDEVKRLRHITSALPDVDALRKKGWTVAVHNDYRLDGERYTFWLFTKGDRAVKGEGKTDIEALAKVNEQLQ